jgi:uridine kinase
MYRAIVTFGIHECIVSGQYVVLVLGIHILQDFHIISLWTIIIHVKPPNVLKVIHNVDIGCTYLNTRPPNGITM